MKLTKACAWDAHHVVPVRWVSLQANKRWFGLITQQAIRCGSFSNVKKLTRKINAFVEQYNAQTSTFAWVATAESIFAKN